MTRWRPLPEEHQISNSKRLSIEIDKIVKQNNYFASAYGHFDNYFKGPFTKD